MNRERKNILTALPNRAMKNCWHKVCAAISMNASNWVKNGTTAEKP